MQSHILAAKPPGSTASILPEPVWSKARQKVKLYTLLAALLGLGLLCPPAQSENKALTETAPETTTDSTAETDSPAESEPETAEDRVDDTVDDTVAEQADEIKLDPDSDPDSNGPDPDGMLQNPFNSPFSQQNFVPDISLILDTSVGGRSLGNDDFGSLSQPMSLRGESELHHAMNPSNGFNLNYAELTMASAIDPFFDLFSVFHFSPTSVEVEEAYFSTRGLPYNLQLKGGKFLSHFGRLNPQHAHFWSFNDQPVIYSAFFGNENLNELGARLSWLAPVDFYLDLGLELLQGVNEGSFGNQGFSLGTQTVAGINLPQLAVATLKTSVDLRDDLVLLAGLSYAQGGTRFAGEASHAHGEDEQAEEEHEDAHAEDEVQVAQVAQTSPNNLPAALDYFAGSSQVLGADLSLRWFPDSYTELTWQSELLFRHVSGQRYAESGPADLQAYQSGLYSQLLWRFHQQWRTGLRLDLMTFNRGVAAGVSTDYAAMLPRYTAMLEFTPSEFSRFRLQYNLDQTRFLAGNQQSIHEVFLQVNLAMGAHGAHVF